MARMHSKKHGKSKSRKPVRESLAKSQVDSAKVEKQIAEYLHKGLQPAIIGQKLKEEHGVMYIKHDLGKSLSDVLEEQGATPQVPYDLLDLMKKAVNINSHLIANKHDVDNRLRMKKIESKIWRLTKYYISRDKLPKGWRYDPKQAELLIKHST